MASRLLTTLAERLFPDAPSRTAFLDSIDHPTGDHKPAIIWTEEPDAVWRQEHAAPFPDVLRPWVPPQWIDVLRDGARIGQDPLYENGALYPLDLSSIWAASPLLSLAPSLGRQVLDLCAAPGGKSIFASRALQPNLLMANEVIGKRLGILRHNLKRCRIPRAWTQRLDPAEWGSRASGAFDVVLVDAPCSGQSLLLKGIDNPGCFHPSVVQHNARRQRRILSEAARALAPGGHMLYTTCTFAPDENEKVITWLLKRTPALAPLEVPQLSRWKSRLAGFPCYRLFPQDGLGAGGFACLLHQVSSGTRGDLAADLLGYPVGD